MKRYCSVGALLIVGALSTGCVDQRYLITSDPPGAMVYRNGVPVGPTPVDEQFVYNGKYHFTLVKDGFETLQVDQDIPYPWYEVPPLDFVSEVLNPFRLHNVQAFNYQMRPAEPANKDDVMRRGEELRQRGQALVPQQEGPPLQPEPGPPIQPQPGPPISPPQPAPPSNP